MQFYDFPRVERAMRTTIFLRYLLIILKTEKFLALVALDYLIGICHSLEADRTNEDGAFHFDLLNAFYTYALVSLFLHLSIFF
jgi:hypothetical protein